MMNYDEQIKMIQTAMGPDADKVKLLLYRLEFQARENLRQPAAEFLETLEIDKDIWKIVELAAKKYGGGAYRVDIVVGDQSRDVLIVSKPFEIAGEPKSLPPQQPRKNLFKDVKNPPFMRIDGNFDESFYKEFMEDFEKHGVDDFLEFLHSVVCTYPAANKFLAECLLKAQDYGWDT